MFVYKRIKVVFATFVTLDLLLVKNRFYPITKMLGHMDTTEISSTPLSL